MTHDRALLAGGCFWGMEELFRHLPGVVSTEVGYTGGVLPNPTYADMKSKNNTHAETLEITFDAKTLPFRKLLEFMFQIHDPTTRHRQGNDVGPSYRSAIFYTNDAQKEIAEKVISEMDASGNWPGPIVTEVVRAGVFYPAEGYHQDYLKHNPGGYTCHYVRPSWKI